MEGQHDTQWHSSLSASHSSVALSTSSGPTTDNKLETKSTNEDNINNDKQASIIVDELDHSKTQARALSHGKTKTYEHKTKHKVDSSTKFDTIPAG